MRPSPRSCATKTLPIPPSPSRFCTSKRVVAPSLLRRAWLSTSTRTLSPLREGTLVVMRERPYSIPGPSEAVSAVPSECRVLAPFERTLGIQGTVELDQCGHEPRPTGLMTGTQPGTTITVEILVERF